MDEHAERRGLGDHLVQQAEPLALETRDELIDAGAVSAWTVQARNDAEPDRIVAGRKNDRDRRGCTLRGKRSDVGRDGDDGGLALDEFGNEAREAIELPFGKAIVDAGVAPGDDARLLQSVLETGDRPPQSLGCAS